MTYAKFLQALGQYVCSLLLVGENDDGRFKFSAVLSSLLFFAKTPCTREWRLQENLVRELVTITILFFFYFLDSPWHELRRKKLIKILFCRLVHR
jgi:hypothetical protein